MPSIVRIQPPVHTDHSTAGDAPTRGDLLEWLQTQPPLYLGAEVALRRPGKLHSELWAAVDGEKVLGLSMHNALIWNLIATDQISARTLALAVLSECTPAKIHLSHDDKERLRPLLMDASDITREHDLVSMRVHSGTAAHNRARAGRWARTEDIPQLKQYQTAYNAERGGTFERDWPDVIRQRRTVVLEHDGAIVSVLLTGGMTPTHATIGGTWTFPAFRRQGFGTQLTAFLIHELLQRHPFVHLVVDDDNAAAIGLYERLGFERIGQCYFAYLQSKPPAP